MRITHLTPSHYRHMPWKNGLGVTTEIARSPREGEIDWRISVARIATDGPFSIFPGCDRVIVALDGAGMILTHHETGVVATLAALEPWSFRGEWTTSCALRGGPIRDFNVITRRAAFSANVSVLVIEGPLSIVLSAATTILYCVSGNPEDMGPDDTLIIEDGVRLPLRGPATLIRVDLVAHVD